MMINTSIVLPSVLCLNIFKNHIISTLHSYYQMWLILKSLQLFFKYNSNCRHNLKRSFTFLTRSEMKTVKYMTEYSFRGDESMKLGGTASKSLGGGWTTLPESVLIGTVASCKVSSVL